MREKTNIAKERELKTEIKELREKVNAIVLKGIPFNDPKLRAARDLLDSAEENLECDPSQAMSSISLARKYIQRREQ
jgi:hypothetical protein